MTSVCFVCLGNICRSPTAEGIFLDLIERAGRSQQFLVDSAGTSGYHEGAPADPRSFSTAQQRGIHLPSRSRMFVADDLARFDFIVAMDQNNLRELKKLDKANKYSPRIHLLRNFDPSCDGAPDLPDPYYGGTRGFEDVFDMCQRACEGLLKHIDSHRAADDAGR